MPTLRPRVGARGTRPAVVPHVRPPVHGQAHDPPGAEEAGQQKHRQATIGLNRGRDGHSEGVVLEKRLSHASREDGISSAGPRVALPMSAVTCQKSLILTA